VRQAFTFYTNHSLIFLAGSMLSKFKKKELEKMSKRMRVAANVPKDSLTQKLKIVATITKAPTDDEETTSGLVSTRKRKEIASPTEHSHSDGRAPSHHATSSEGHTLSRDMMVV